MESQRISTWWIKMPDLYWPDLDNLDRIKRRAEGFAKANVSAAMIFGTHFRWDYIPYLPLLHDYLATVAEELHSYGIKLYDHHSVNLVHRYDTREELRRVMTHSGPHLPFSPSREAAASWTYKGMRLNNWRMKDVRTGEPLYLPHYTAEGFCHRNPEFIYAYKEYLKELIADTGIDGLSADDGMYYMQYNACGCEHCRAELKRRSGIDLPPVEDRSRVNYITKVAPAGVDGKICICTDKTPTVYMPFTPGEVTVTVKDGKCAVTLPENCSYAILEFLL